MIAEEDADSAWVAHLAGCAPDAAERYLADGRAETRLFRHLAREHAAEGRSSYVEIDAPLELYALVRLRRPRHVVEVGVSSGVSSAYMLQALSRNERGTLHSVDLPSRPRRTPSGGISRNASWSIPEGRSSGWAVPFALRARWDLRLGDKREVIPLLAEELPELGMFVYDVPHNDAEAYREFRRLDHRMSAGAVAICDHGPGGELCSALRRWAVRRGGKPLGRKGLGLYGFACRQSGGISTGRPYCQR